MNYSVHHDAEGRVSQVVVQTQRMILRIDEKSVQVQRSTPIPLLIETNEYGTMTVRTENEPDVQSH